MSVKRRRRRLSEKEYEQLERKETQLESDARSESEDRQERIKILWDAITSGELAQDAKDLADNELIRSLTELAQKQKCEIEYLGKFRRDWERIHAHYPEKLEQLDGAILVAELRPLLATLPKRKPQAVFEDKRRTRRQPGDVGLIEWEFGGGAEEQRPKVPMALPYEPTCLDEIFAGGAVRMRSEDVALNAESSRPLAWWLPKAQHKVGLEELFGMERHRFGKGLPRFKKGRERWYNYRAVVKIMHRLLNEEPPKGKKPRRGKTRRLWLGDRNKEMRVLSGIVARRVLTGIVARMKSLSVSEDIWDAFTAVVCFHLTRGIEGRLSEDVKNALATLVRRYLA
jgi:anti-sigma28 factor (negative regulator of flagellin synthesis)